MTARSLTDPAELSRQGADDRHLVGAGGAVSPSRKTAWPDRHIRKIVLLAIHRQLHPKCVCWWYGMRVHPSARRGSIRRRCLPGDHRVRHRLHENRISAKPRVDHLSREVIEAAIICQAASERETLRSWWVVQIFAIYSRPRPTSALRSSRMFQERLRTFRLATKMRHYLDALPFDAV